MRALMSLLAACAAAAEAPPLGPARVVSHWPAARSGDHRVRVRVRVVESVSVLEIEWRLPLGLGVHGGLSVREGQGRTLKHVVPLFLSSERALLLLRPRTAGTHLVHFLPYDASKCAETGPASACRVTHTRSGTPSRPLLRWVPAWVCNRSTVEAPLSALAWEALSALPRVQVVSIESRSARDSFHPMEVRATAAELDELRARVLRRRGRMGSRGTRRAGSEGILLLFPESAARPIRMRDAPPAHWIRNWGRDGTPGALNQSALSLEARPGEFLSFQIGAFAVSEHP
ncbi:hypothetical protein T492DRAFT_1121979 [Pavlovales sp. CCMP2436]|nr:hypothetical protein T492DRAFT_1121979 [Pavlovales sp. CCMP2436]